MKRRPRAMHQPRISSWNSTAEKIGHKKRASVRQLDQKLKKHSIAACFSTFTRDSLHFHWKCLSLGEIPKNMSSGTQPSMHINHNKFEVSRKRHELRTASQLFNRLPACSNVLELEPFLAFPVMEAVCKACEKASNSQTINEVAQALQKKLHRLVGILCLLQKQKTADGSGAKTREKQHKYLQAKENRRELNSNGAKNISFAVLDIHYRVWHIFVWWDIHVCKKFRETILLQNRFNSIPVTSATIKFCSKWRFRIFLKALQYSHATRIW